MAAPKSPIPELWTVAGITGPFKDYLVDSVTRLVDGIQYNTAKFPRTLTPSDLLKGLFKEKQVDVAARFAKAMDYVSGTCAKHAPCNKYFRSLGKGLSLADFFAWEIRFWFYKPAQKAAPEGFSADRIGVTVGEVISSGTNAEGRPWARIAIGEPALVSHIKLAATIVHELAHLAGAKGATAEQAARASADKEGDEYKSLIAAETALKHCLLGKQFDKEAIGLLHDDIPGWRGRGGRWIA
jgi:hypothetical protein